MNEEKWLKAKNASPDRLFAKLAEEFGEVGKAKNEQTLADLDMELSHLIFIAEVMRWRIARRRFAHSTPPSIRRDYDSLWHNVV